MRLEGLKAVLFFAGSCIWLASCGGGDEQAATTGGGGNASPSVGAPAPSAPGMLLVTVTNNDGEPLKDAEVYATGVSQLSIPKTDANGEASVSLQPATFRVSARHALGYSATDSVNVTSGGATSVTLSISPGTVFASALLPPEHGSTRVSADLRSADFGISILSRAFTRSSYGNPAATSPTTPLVRLDDCNVWLDSLRTTPTCGPWSRGETSVVAYEFNAAGRSIYSGAQKALATVVLLDQSRRAADYDPYGLRRQAAQQFVKRARNGATPDLIAIGGFAGPESNGASSARLPQTPVWLPASDGVFTADRSAALEAVKQLVPLTGGGAPLFDSLESAIRLIASRAPASHRRAIVAIVGGGDEGGLSANQRQHRLDMLRQLQRDAQVEVLLIPGSLTETSSDRLLLAELASALHAPLVFAGLPKDWGYQPDGLYSAINLAADMLIGVPLQAIDAVFRVPSEDPTGFVAGMRYEGSLSVETDLCPMGCAEPPMHFSVAIP